MNRKLIYFFGALGGLLFGFDSGIVSGAMTPIEFKFLLTSSQVGFMTASVLLGSFLGALVVGRLSDRFGRKKLLFASSLVFVIGSICSALSFDFPTICASRIFLGIGIGIASAVVPAYLSEIAPTKIRGTISTLFQFLVVTGLLSSYIVDLSFLRKAFWGLDNWQLMLGSAAIPAIILFLGSIFIPESPRYLINVGREQEAIAILTKLRDSKAEVSAEVKDIKQIASQEKGTLLGLIKHARIALIAACGVSLIEQFLGINAIFYYGPVIASDITGKVNQNIWYSQLHQDLLITILFGVVNFLSTVVAVAIMDKFKRRTLLFFGSYVMFVGCTLFGIIKAFNLSVSPYISLIIIFIYIFAFAISWGPIGWVLNGEIFPLKYRGAGSSMGAASSWLGNFIIMFLFPILSHQVDGVAQSIQVAFFTFAAFCVVSIFFVHKCVPETSGKSLEQIEAEVTTK